MQNVTLDFRSLRPIFMQDKYRNLCIFRTVIFDKIFEPISKQDVNYTYDIVSTYICV